MTASEAQLSGHCRKSRAFGFQNLDFYSGSAVVTPRLPVTADDAVARNFRIIICPHNASDSPACARVARPFRDFFIREGSAFGNFGDYRKHFLPERFHTRGSLFAYSYE